MKNEQSNNSSMNAFKNPRLWKEKLLSIVLIPAIGIASIFIFAYLNGVVMVPDLDSDNIPYWLDNAKTNIDILLLCIYFLLIIELLYALWLLISLKIARLVEHIARILTVIGTFFLSAYLSPPFTQTIEKFQVEKRYYLRYIKTHKYLNPIYDTFRPIEKENTMCYIAYNETNIATSNRKDLQNCKVIELEPYFSYVCCPKNN
ncbi:hypothetical protein [Sulfurospirillum sp. hDNRA2]|uniref:hypothetical protein n=1 Tax=Sulfurospirillum sp. hDNRA2 TaxID=3237298 RepID=UPI0020B7ED2F|nr:hypothetical protein [Sulfurospirillum sp. DNRA8]MCP3651017.1 hypothetical protein [Sulfurospirillum sp. DNRA8]MCR1809863.1 hypothetical protein [Sulfurospirillum sp. DNRA8]